VEYKFSDRLFSVLCWRNALQPVARNLGYTPGKHIQGAIILKRVVASFYVLPIYIHSNRKIQSLSSSKATKMNEMFFGAESFNQSVSTWQVESVVDFSNMFRDAISFNASGSEAWVVTSNAKNMRSMFRNATSFDAEIGGWDTSNVVEYVMMITTTSNVELLT
jgi:Mycoplasma protein of unknown function, DUF285